MLIDLKQLIKLTLEVHCGINCVILKRTEFVNCSGEINFDSGGVRNDAHINEGASVDLERKQMWIDCYQNMKKMEP